jgi:hypothetical protein
LICKVLLRPGGTGRRFADIWLSLGSSTLGRGADPHPVLVSVLHAPARFGLWRWSACCAERPRSDTGRGRHCSSMRWVTAGEIIGQLGLLKRPSGLAPNQVHRLGVAVARGQRKPGARSGAIVPLEGVEDLPELPPALSVGGSALHGSRSPPMCGVVSPEDLQLPGCRRQAA